MSSLDLKIFYAIHDLVGASDALDYVGIFAASLLLPLMVGMLFAAIPFIKRHDHIRPREIIIHALCAVGIGFLIRELITVIQFRARPFVAIGFEPLIALRFVDSSFPSNHATIAFALAVTVLRYDRLWGAVFLTAACMVAFGRVFVGVHYPSDVLGGALLGSFAAYMVGRIEHYEWEKVSRRLRG